MNYRYELFWSPKDRQYYFRLKAGNSEPIFQSEGYVRKAGAENGIHVLRQRAQDLNNYLQHGTLLTHYWFTVLAANGEPLGRSETYPDKSPMLVGVYSVQRNAPIAPVLDLTALAA